MNLYSPLIDPLLPLTMEQFNKIPDGEIFAKGELPDNETGINMTTSGRMLRWLAKKGFGNDWAIYCFWAKRDKADPIRKSSPISFLFHDTETDWDYIKKMGDKVKDKTNISRCISVSDEVMKLYRF